MQPSDGLHLLQLGVEGVPLVVVHIDALVSDVARGGVVDDTFQLRLVKDFGEAILLLEQPKAPVHQTSSEASHHE